MRVFFTRARYGLLFFLILVGILGSMFYSGAQSSAPPPNRCLSTPLYASAPRANVELYPYDIRLVFPDGTFQYVSPLHAVLVLTNPIATYKVLETNYAVESAHAPLTPIYYGTVRNMTSGYGLTALWFVDRDLVSYLFCV